MMKKLISLLLLIPGALFAQTESQALRKVTDKLIANYNDTKYDSIFCLFAPTMQKALPPDKTTAFFSGLNAQAGKIRGLDIMQARSDFGLYKTTFERAVMTLSVSLDDSARINGLYVRPFTEDMLPKLERNATRMGLPFTGKWLVVWGGDSREQNAHADFPAQRYAFDFVMTDAAGKSYRSDGKTNADYMAFGKPVLAPCDGIVVQAVDGVRDNAPGEMNPAYAPGNSVLLRTDSSEYVLLGHLQRHSIRVKEGDRLRLGDVIGLCGNSGNSSEPHVHFHIQNGESLQASAGAKCYFEAITVNGVSRTDHSPVKGDQVEP